ncbi:mucin-associated surface protein (MASP), putative [Trypanosoma cruzi marinkellei]|uniref:Mucin-associated surface protein (MASP), putative n=1 Tax=Trypanosoma cruzi marinkellei TaxID=85056 RepID=K2MUL2_TRYCR|nr:mucin-associated surface protein (MASP), putative [Trypanosoma cruzi marinkellei]
MMAMMMTGRVLLVCALCVLWCGVSGIAVNDDRDVITVGDLSNGTGDLNSEELSSSGVRLQDGQEQRAAGKEGGSPGSQGAKDTFISDTGIHVPPEGNVNLGVDPSKTTEDQYKKQVSTEAGVDMRNQTAPPSRPQFPAGLSPPVGSSLLSQLEEKGKEEEVQRVTTHEENELKKAPQGHGNAVHHQSTKQHEVIQEEELEQEQNTQKQLLQEQYESERLQVQPENQKENQRQEELQEEQQKQEKQAENIKQEEVQKQQKKQKIHERQKQKDEIQDQRQQQHEHSAENKEESAGDKNAVGKNATATVGDSDSSTAVFYNISPLLLPLLVVVCAAAAAVVAA